MDCKLMQPLNTSFARKETLFGSTMEVIFLQSRKAPVPIVYTLDGMVKLRKDLHPANISLSKTRILAFIVAC